MRKAALLLSALIFLLNQQGNAHTKTQKNKGTSVAAKSIADEPGDGDPPPGCATSATANVFIAEPVIGSTTGSVSVITPLGIAIVYSIDPVDDLDNATDATLSTQSSTIPLPAGQSYKICSSYAGENCFSGGVLVTITPSPAPLTPTTTAMTNTLPVSAQPPKNASPRTQVKKTSEKHQLTYKIIKSEQNTFGYDILDYNRPMIHQPSVPGIPGNKGFATKEDAAKVAKLVIKKINKNIMPPSVTLQELTTLKIKL